MNHQPATAEHTTTAAGDDADDELLSWSRSDIEQRLGFHGARHTRVNNLVALLAGLLTTAAFYAVLIYFKDSYLAVMFRDRGPTPYFIVFLSMWSLAILFIKWRKLVLQRSTLSISVLPSAHDFILSPTTVDEVTRRLYEVTDDPKHFILFNRIQIALSNLKNLGRVSDVDEILRSQAETDEGAMDTSYSSLRGFIWAIPVLGFIGTVLGLSEAIGAFGGVLGSSSDMDAVTASLRQVTGGLATAFETTLEALVAALAIQLMATFLRKSEEEFLDDAREYCNRNIVNRLRMTPFDRIAD
ncbi:MotA/TolQ/ExbB proton channel family protein [Lacipirellula sp.]|uniref:MotA/TolQ/ExbB proton channel family protein n=1 Tax=Lacipirellula sp. TaxID=2691419 RepID=UPI003D0BC043